MVTQETVEIMVLNYIEKHLRNPKYLLLDSLNFNRFNASLKSKERLKITPEPVDSGKIRAIQTTSVNQAIGILEVNTPEEMIELVG